MSTRRSLLIAAVATVVGTVGIGVIPAACSGGADGAVTTTLSAPATSIVLVSTTNPGTTGLPDTTTASDTTTSAIPTTTTAGGPVTSSTSPGSPTTATTTAAPTGWQKAPTGLQELAAQLAQRLPAGQSVDLPDHLPAGWALAMPGQVYGDAVAGYFADLTENPAIATNEGVEEPFGEYRVVFTNGKELAGILVVIGDWGETDFREVTAYGSTLYLYEDENLVAVVVPGWDFGTVVGTPGAREAALEMAASIKSW